MHDGKGCWKRYYLHLQPAQRHQPGNSSSYWKCIFWWTSSLLREACYSLQERFFFSILIFGRSIFLFLGDNFTKYVDILRDLFIFLLILFLHFCLFSWAALILCFFLIISILNQTMTYLRCLCLIIWFSLCRILTLIWLFHLRFSFRCFGEKLH